MKTNTRATGSTLEVMRHVVCQSPEHYQIVVFDYESAFSSLETHLSMATVSTKESLTRERVQMEFPMSAVQWCTDLF